MVRCGLKPCGRSRRDGVLLCCLTDDWFLSDENSDYYMILEQPNPDLREIYLLKRLHCKVVRGEARACQQVWDAVIGQSVGLCTPVPQASARLSQTTTS